MLSCMVLSLLTSKAETASSGGSTGASFNKALAIVTHLPKHDFLRLRFPYEEFYKLESFGIIHTIIDR